MKTLITAELDPLAQSGGDKGGGLTLHVEWTYSYGHMVIEVRNGVAYVNGEAVTQATEAAEQPSGECDAGGGKA